MKAPMVDQIAQAAVTLALKAPLSGFLMPIKRVPDPVFAQKMAETRLRVVLDDDTQVDESGLQKSGVDGVMRLPNQIMHLIVGLNADQYAAEMHGQLAGA